MVKRMEKMKTLLLVMLAALGFLVGCATSGKFIAASSTTVDKAMKSWAAYVVEGHATPAQEEAVRRAHKDYLASEDLALAALESGSKPDLQTARKFLTEHQAALLQLVELFSRKETR